MTFIIIAINRYHVVWFTLNIMHIM